MERLVRHAAVQLVTRDATVVTLVAMGIVSVTVVIVIRLGTVVELVADDSFLVFTLVSILVACVVVP